MKLEVSTYLAGKIIKNCLHQVLYLLRRETQTRTHSHANTHAHTHIHAHTHRAGSFCFATSAELEPERKGVVLCFAIMHNQTLLLSFLSAFQQL